jgi:hypothetical protein
MPILYTREYPHELFDLNPELRCVFVESHERRGGGRSTVRVRGLEDVLAFNFAGQLTLLMVH